MPQDRECRSTEHNRFAASLAVGEHEQAPLQVDMSPLQVENLAKTRACEEKQAERESDLGRKDGPLVWFFREMLVRTRISVEAPGKPVGFREPQRLPETLELFSSKKPFPLGFFEPLEADRGVRSSRYQPPPRGKSVSAGTQGTLRATGFV